MAQIGTFGSVVFEVSAKKTLTFKKLSHDVGADYGSIDLMSGKPRSQFGGPTLESVSLDITLRADLGVKPRDMLETLRTLCQEGEANMLIIGGSPVCPLPMVITKVSESWDTVYKGGALWQASVSLTLEEYQ